MDVSARRSLMWEEVGMPGENPHVQADGHYTATCTVDHGDRTRVAATWSIVHCYTRSPCSNSAFILWLVRNQDVDFIKKAGSSTRLIIRCNFQLFDYFFNYSFKQDSDIFYYWYYRDYNWKKVMLFTNKVSRSRNVNVDI